MSSFSMVLLEEGVEMELPTGLSELLAILDQKVPGFACDGYGYELASVSRAMLGSRWDLVVKLVNLQTREVIEAPVGGIEMEKLDNYSVNFRIPPRAEQDYPGISKFDWDGHFFGSLICQLLNTFQDKGLIKLPGVLPVS